MRGGYEEGREGTFGYVGISIADAENMGGTVKDNFITKED